MTIYGIIGIKDTGTKITTLAQGELLSATNDYLEMHNKEVALAENIFVEVVTEAFKFRYEAAGGGFMQRRGGLSRVATVKTGGGWDVEIPLEGFGDDLGVPRDEFGYMSLLQWQRFVDNIRMRSLNTRRFEMMRAIYNNTVRPFRDRWAGDLNIRPLAITSDGVIYPPGIGQINGATAQHYITSDTYDETGINNSNNPFKLTLAPLAVHNPDPQNLVTFINSAQQGLVEALADFVAVPEKSVQMGANANQAVGAPDVPGNVIGKINGQWVSVWDAGTPARYMLTRDLDVEAPLYRRRHPASTGIGDGLRLVSESDTEPVRLSSYEDDFGYGVVNRIGAVVLELTLDATYDIPAVYA